MKNIIRGKVIYKYHRTNYMEQPEHTRIVKVQYDEEANISYVKLRRVTYFTEFLCSLIILSNILFLLLNIRESNISIQYNSVVNYYNGKLYVNIHSADDNIRTVEIKIMSDNFEYSKKLEPGEYISEIEIGNDNIDSQCTLYIIDKVLWSENIKEYSIVINKLE